MGTGKYKYRYAFYVSGKAGRLEQMINTNSSILQNTFLVFSDSSSNDYLKKKLAEKDIFFYIKDYQAYKKDRRNAEMSDKLLVLLNDFKIDYCFSFGVHILRGELLIIYKNRIINFHPSLLPKYSGLCAIDQAIANGEDVLGNTAHFIDEGSDTGEIILQQQVPRKVFDRYGYDGILNNQITMLEEIVGLIESGKMENTYAV